MLFVFIICTIIVISGLCKIVIKSKQLHIQICREFGLPPSVDMQLTYKRPSQQCDSDNFH